MTHHRHITAGLVVALAGGAFMASGCGESGSPAAAKVSARTDKVDYTRFLMRNGEQPGFRRVESVVTEDAETFAANARLTKAELSRMRRAGMGTATYQPTEGPNSRGVTNVTLFASAQGARQWLAQEQREGYIRRQMPSGGKLRRFVVPGIPGARGWSASKDSHIVGNIFWVQGRCLMILGHESTGPFDGPLATGAHAIYQRTKGQCP
jgi:hypothetical protein